MLGCAVIASAALSCYLLLLAIASFRGPREVALPNQARGHSEPATHFAILVPAHEEELVIGRLLVSIKDLDYPRRLFDVHVVADHCSDQTAAIARSLGATVYERCDPDPRGKSLSLRWLVHHILECRSGKPVDALVVFDADSMVSPNFLRHGFAHALG